MCGCRCKYCKENCLHQLSVCTPNSCVSAIHFKLIDGKTDEELENLANDEEVINLISQCGETSVLRVCCTLEGIITQSVMLTLINQNRMADDVFQN